MSKKIYVTRRIPNIGLEMLKKEGFEVKVSEKDTVLSKDELLSEIRNFQPDALLCLLTDNIDEDVLSAAPIKICATYSVGFNHINLEAAKKMGVTVTNTPGVLTNAVMEFTIAAIFSLTKRIVEADKFTRAGNYKGWEPELLLGMELHNKTLGVLGAGRIGANVAKAMHGLGMEVFYYDMRQNSELDEMGIRFADKDEILRVSDILTVHVPLFDSTRHFLSVDEFKIMKNSALLVNTSRGPVIDERALLTALKTKEIAGAFLDVFENEPEFERDFAAMNNVILTPHIASATMETRNEMSVMAAQSIIDFFLGKKPKYIVDLC